jgi:hypothetical protein
MINHAFPEYDTTTLPPIPTMWIDVSYRNDVCPSWIANEFHIFVERANPEEREYPEVERYTVLERETGGVLLQSDNWDDVLDYVNGIQKQRIGVNCRDRQSAERLAVCKFDNRPKIETIEGGYRVTWELKRIGVWK